MEIKYILNGYGVPTDNIPISLAGKIKVISLKQWIRVRQVLEQDLRTDSSTSKTEKQSLKDVVVECPYSDDILFKRGTSGMFHPGNVKFRSLIQSKYEQGDLITTKSLVSAILDEIANQKLRVLAWDEQESWISRIDDKKLIYKKIEYIVRDFQFSLTKYQMINRRAAATTTAMTTATAPKRAKLQSATSLFCAQDGTKQR